MYSDTFKCCKLFILYKTIYKKIKLIHLFHKFVLYNTGITVQSKKKKNNVINTPIVNVSLLMEQEVLHRRYLVL